MKENSKRMRTKRGGSTFGKKGATIKINKLGVINGPQMVMLHLMR